MIGKIFAELYKNYGEQQWWSSYTPFEKMLLALLTQYTSQTASKIEGKTAFKLLKKQQIVTPDALNKITTTQLATWLTAEKAKQIKYYSQWYLEQGGFEALKKLDILSLRNALLSIEGVGIDKETADLILLYAFKRPVFIIDENTRRIFYRLGLINGDEPHDELRHLMTLFLDEDTGLFNEYHALLTQHAIDYCREEPQCKNCPLDALCPE